MEVGVADGEGVGVEEGADVPVAVAGGVCVWVGLQVIVGVAVGVPDGEEDGVDDGVSVGVVEGGVVGEGVLEDAGVGVAGLTGQ